MFGSLWGLQNLGQLVAGVSGLSGADIAATLAWDRTVGDPSVVIADIDTGYAFDHPDLAPVAWRNPGETPGDGIDNDGNGYVDDWRGWDTHGGDNDPGGGSHGTHTAGTIGARGGNGLGVSGVAQNVRIMPVRALSDGSGTLAAIVEAINYAGRNGARAANMSLTSPLRFLAVNEALAANPRTRRRGGQLWR